MKPAPFEYYAPATMDEALALLAEHGYEAKALAGGQSLIPMMNFRLVQPSVLVDLNNIGGLAHITPGADGSLRIGALTRHNQVETSAVAEQYAPLIHFAMQKIAYPAVRTRGTFGGSLAHADPSAELPALCTALNGRFRLISGRGERWVSADEFFISLFTTALEPDELLAEAEIPAMPPRSGWSLMETARRPHDFALMGVAAVVALDEQGRCADARIVFLSAGEKPMSAQKAAEALRGQSPSAEAIRAAAESAAANEIDPADDIHGTAKFRRHLANVLCRRALEQAFQRAAGEK
ncbi:MAG: 6-hydroxypseudooxynicotine dehydrogenase complex subunit alpha [Anaerolineales bacterium]|nr:6-hydroxypseudooxynicotine dehydrogenase complex subunit alpha [Anaerolineales bacterium]